MASRKHYVFAAVGVLFLFLMGTVSQAVPVRATISSIVGDVQVKAPGGSWQPAKAGALLENGTEIKTGAKSSCVLRWSSQNTFKLTPFTQFTVKSIDVDPRTKTAKSDLDLFMGEAKYRAEKLQNPNSRFDITTPAAVAGVRGTTGDIGSDASGNTTGNVYDGTVDFTAQGQTVTAHGGQQVVVNSGEPPQEPTDVPEDEMYACETNEDCMSGLCEDGQCVGESDALTSGCAIEGAACAAAADCCDGYGCSEEGLCVMEAAEAACLAGGETCEDDDACCSKSCKDNICEEEEEVAECVDDGEACEVDEDCCNEDCEDNVCVGEEVAECKDEEEACEEDEECCSGDCEDGFCTEEEEEQIYCTLSADGDEFCLMDESVTVTGESLEGANCDVNGESATAGDDGSFTVDVMFDSAGELELAGACSDEEGATAECELVVNVKDYPELIISSPAEGFVSCPHIDIAGMTEPGAMVNVNGVSLFDDTNAEVYSDGAFSFDGFELFDCAAPLDFEAVDQCGQITKLTVSPGTSHLGGDFTGDITVTLQPSGQWVGGMTEVLAKVTAKSINPIPYGMLVSLDSTNPGHLGDGILEPMSGVTAADVYYGVAEVYFEHGPAYPLTVTATVGGQTSEAVSIFLDDSAVSACAPVAGTPGDGIDNDCDGLIDEEVADGIDNDWDGRVDEDQACDFTDENLDCDKDGVLNGVDCVPFDPAVSITVTSDECLTTYDQILTSIESGDIAEPDDGIDNDGDGLYDEEAIDGADNDGDGLIDEDTTAFCDPNLPDGDCDYDGVPNGNDCKPLDPAVTTTKYNDDGTWNDACAVRCDPFANPDGDCDKDGLSNAEEIAIGLDPNKSDTDGDTYLDAYELTYGYDPWDPFSPSSDEITAAEIFDDYAEEGDCAGGTVSADGLSCECPGEITFVKTADKNSCVCYDGEVLLSDGTCACPAGTVWDATLNSCVTSDWTQCADGEFMDWAVDSCVTACSGGQVGDTVMWECYCPDGTFMDYNLAKCVSSCPAGTVEEYGECVCAPETPYYDPITDACASQCSGGQVADPYYLECYCPEGTYLDWDSLKCVETTSETICPAGTAGAGCDYYAIGDCDGDGISNSTDEYPCLDDGSAECPADTHGAGCDPAYGDGDCDGDGQVNMYDPCPCMYGSPGDDYCPPPPSTCPDGQFLDYLSGTCVTTCPEGFVGDTATGECVCADGTYLDPNTGYCISECPEGMVADDSGGCVCGSTAPYWDDYLGMCVSECSGGQVPALDYPECVCPAGYYFDYDIGQCVAMDGCDLTPYPDGCACTADADCESTICDPYDGVCAPPLAGCNNDGMCDPSVEDSVGCSADCKCGDGVCDNYEWDAQTCPGDCGTYCDGGCDYGVYNDDCDGDGILNQDDMEPCVPDSDTCPADTDGAGCDPFISGDCDNDGFGNLSDGCPCMAGPADGDGCDTTGGPVCGDGMCDFDLGEDNANCPQDCVCDFDGTCEETLGEYADWCCDCAGTECVVDGICDYPYETPESCASDCPCNYNGVCDTGETYDWCEQDCPTCTPSGNLSTQEGADCCEEYNLCDGMCVTFPPPDDDGDGVPNDCDQCPSDPGDPANYGCPSTATEPNCTTIPYDDGCSCIDCSECLSTSFCNIDGFCQSCPTTPPIPNGCSCTADADCQSNFCDPATGTCEPSTLDCSAVPYPDGCSCTTDLDCQSGFCDPADGTCKPDPCSVVPYPDGCSCTTNLDCQSGFCDPATGTCDVDPCTQPSMRPAGCSCTLDSECESNFCDTTDYTCKTDPACGTMPYPDGCDCTTGADCQSGFCDSTDWTCKTDCGVVPYPDGCTCTTDTDCQSNYCDTVSYTCAPNCSVIPYDDGCPCATNTECGSAICDMCTGTCVTTSSPDTDGDGVPDACDACPETFGDPLYDGCPETCPTCP